MRRNWLVLLVVCVAVVMMAVLPGCRSKSGGDQKVMITGAGTYTFKVANLKWEKVKDPANTNMSKLATSDYEQNPNKIETEEGTPDFSKVTGGGFIILTSGNADGNFDLRNIKFKGSSDEVDETFDKDEVGSPDSQTMVEWQQKTNLAISKDTGYGWIAYVEDSVKANLVQLDKYYGGRIKFYGTTEGDGGSPSGSGTKAGSYAYSLFAKNPVANETPAAFDKELNMTDGEVTVDIGAEGDGAYPVEIGLLLRDASSNWFLGKQ